MDEDLVFKNENKGLWNSLVVDLRTHHGRRKLAGPQKQSHDLHIHYCINIPLYTCTHKRNNAIKISVHLGGLKEATPTASTLITSNLFLVWLSKKGSRLPGKKWLALELGQERQDELVCCSLRESWQTKNQARVQPNPTTESRPRQELMERLHRKYSLGPNWREVD